MRRVSGCGALIKAIDAYLAKADNDLEDALEKEGFAQPKDTVKRISDLEDELADVLTDETDYFLRRVERSVDLEQFASDVWPSVKLDDTAKRSLAQVFREQFESFMPEYVAAYLQQTDKELRVESVSRRTTAWIESWSEELSEIMQLTSHEEMETILTKGLEEGIGIDIFTKRILESGIRDERYRARQTALTEVLRAHSVAQQEGFAQSPAVTEKLWRHTGAYRTKPRPNHVAMDGARVPKDQPFTLYGADGGTYYPMFPRDPSLPPGECISCHCLSQGLVDPEILGLSLEERQEMQRKALEEMDIDYEPPKAAADPADGKLGLVQAMSHDERVSFFGGGDAGAQRAALVESGVISTEADMSQLYKTTASGKSARKTLNELTDSGIMTVTGKAVRHSTIGDYTATGGRLRGGCHSADGMAELDRRGIAYNITGTYSNGVRVGNIPDHKERYKRSGSGQSWFPDDWDDAKIRAAGTAVANSGEPIIMGYYQVGEYDGVMVRVLYTTDGSGKIASVCPDYNQDLLEGVTLND